MATVPVGNSPPRFAEFRVVLLAILLSLACLAANGCRSARRVGVSASGDRTFRFLPRRPAAAFDTVSPPRFVDVTKDAGIRYAWTIPGERPLTILQTIGNGCAFLDFDRDGNLDILLVGPKLALYSGDGKGHFADASAETGINTLTGHFLGCAVGDYDNDGYPDLYISAYRGGILLHNEGGKAFRDVTLASGLRAQPWGTTCAFADVDGDGLLDLYIANYVVYDTTTVEQLCIVGGVETSCGPLNYAPLPGVLYRNRDGKRFADITQSSGAVGTGKGLGVACADLDGTGRISIAIANDEMPGDLLVPTGKGDGLRFSNLAQDKGLAFDRDGNTHGGMGIDIGDYDNDGAFDVVVATYQDEARSLYHNDGDGLFMDRGSIIGLGREIAQAVGFGCKFFDYDNDGWLDIALANGHVQDNVRKIHPEVSYRQPTHLLHNSGGEHLSFQEVGVLCSALRTPIVGRGLAVGDYDNDGRLDMLVVDSEGSPLLLHNDNPQTNHWLGVSLVGKHGNRDGYGAVVTASAGKQKWVRRCHADGSYLSSSDARVHFGLGGATRLDSLSVRWPDGRTDTFRNLPVDRYYTLRQGDPRLP